MTENEAIKRCDMLINGLSINTATNKAFEEDGKDYPTFATMKEFAQTCKKVLEEIQQYRAIGTVEELKSLKENGAFTGMELAQIVAMQMKLKKYQSIGTVDEFKALKEKMEEIYKIAMCEQQATSCEYTRLKSFEMIENILGIH